MLIGQPATRNGGMPVRGGYKSSGYGSVARCTDSDQHRIKIRDLQAGEGRGASIPDLDGDERGAANSKLCQSDVAEKERNLVADGGAVVDTEWRNPVTEEPGAAAGGTTISGPGFWSGGMQ